MGGQETGLVIAVVVGGAKGTPWKLRSDESRRLWAPQTSLSYISLSAHRGSLQSSSTAHSYVFQGTALENLRIFDHVANCEIDAMFHVLLKE